MPTRPFVLARSLLRALDGDFRVLDRLQRSACAVVSTKFLRPECCLSCVVRLLGTPVQATVLITDNPLFCRRSYCLSTVCCVVVNVVGVVVVVNCVVHCRRHHNAKLDAYIDTCSTPCCQGSASADEWRGNAYSSTCRG